MPLPASGPVSTSAAPPRPESSSVGMWAMPSLRGQKATALFETCSAASASRRRLPASLRDQDGSSVIVENVQRGRTTNPGTRPGGTGDECELSPRGDRAELGAAKTRHHQHVQ